MKIAVIGATGFVGQAVCDEALARGHQVIAISRNARPADREADAPPTLTRVAANILDTAQLQTALQGCDVAIHAYAPPRSDSVDARIAQQTAGTKSIIEAVKHAKISRLIAVGGAGTAEVAPGVRLMDSYFFPPQYEGGAKSTAVIKELLAQEQTLDWVFISPPNMLEHGARTGRYRTGKDELIIDLQSGRSHISVADYAVALLDEAEHPRHHRERFTVGA